jgi:6-phosphofructokinase 1
VKRNAIIGQSGGPTSVINASLVGILEAAGKSKKMDGLYGMSCGIQGLMGGEFVDLSTLSKAKLQALKATPSSALGSSRHKLKDEDFPGILEVLDKFDIHYLFLIGGNDTMDTVNRVERYCREQGYELIGVGIPKTVDNDLFGTDHAPGFASAARANILNVMQGGLLARDMQRVDSFVIYQTIGRDAGWLAAATALAAGSKEEAPHLIYMPERPFHDEQFLEDSRECIEKYGWVSIVCGEGIKYEEGTPVSESRTKDSFDNVEFGAMGGVSVGMNLHAMLRDNLGLRGEFQITESLIMSAMDRVVPNDLEEAYLCGSHAAALAERGESGYMVTIERLRDNPYSVTYGKIELDEVAIKAKPMPVKFINERGNHVTEGFFDYMEPLVGELPEYIRIEKNYITKP